MRFLADMGLAQSTIAFLRAQGHDAVHLREQGLQQLEDVEIVRKARAEGRVILTHDSRNPALTLPIFARDGPLGGQRALPAPGFVRWVNHICGNARRRKSDTDRSERVH